MWGGNDVVGPMFTAGYAEKAARLAASPLPFATCVRASGLGRCFDDSRLALDNNPAERALRCVAIGRKNYLFAGSGASGRRAGACTRRSKPPSSTVSTRRSTSPTSSPASPIARPGKSPNYCHGIGIVLISAALSPNSAPSPSVCGMVNPVPNLARSWD